MSWQAKVVELALGAMGRAAAPKDMQAVRADVLKKQAAAGPVVPPKSMSKGMEVTADTFAGVPVFRIRKHGSTPQRAVCYLHGGSYTYEIHPLQWGFQRKLALEADVEVYVVIYTLAPISTASKTVPAATAVLEQVIKNHGAANVTLMGDSAGGGMALAVAQAHRDSGAEQVGKIVLIAPWLDVQTDDPRQRPILKHDKMLSPAALQESGRMWAGELATDDPLASPIYGEVSGLPHMDVWIGTYDLFYIDALRLKEKAGDGVTLHVGPKMQHVYPILPFVPEASEGRRQIVELLKR